MAKIKQQASFQINRSAGELFPLFSAEGEKLWVPGWDYENIMGSTDLHEDYIFLTAGHHPSRQHRGRNPHTAYADHGHHDHSQDMEEHHQPELHDAPITIWLVKRHEPSRYFVQFYRVEPEDKVAIVTVQCKPLENDGTEVEVAYEFIGLSEKGNDFVAYYSAEAHEEFISAWPELLAQYFEAK